MNFEQLDYAGDSPLIFVCRSLAWVLVALALVRVNLFVWGIY